MNINSLIRSILKLPFIAYLKIHEHIDSNGIRYVKLNKGSKILGIVFSAFDSDDKKRSYNYVRSLGKLGIDFLFLSDKWGYRGSYYLKDRGTYDPIAKTQRLINQIVAGGV